MKTSEKYCVCGHLKNVHWVDEWNPNCSKCPAGVLKQGTNEYLWRHKFQLDNLKLIEDLAKERNLV